MGPSGWKIYTVGYIVTPRAKEKTEPDEPPNVKTYSIGFPSFTLKQRDGVFLEVGKDTRGILELDTRVFHLTMIVQSSPELNDA